ncbi:COP9 signalosome complex subunit 1-like isoform X2 [Gigantopelta aegis]|uniref:COP9 signalosome complex subunit 1-like isoform X2 n=1 Tax=Gigantopelta aegis TaxID=1735272 RepID=UPI001B889F38|nr:COP9 signalosome complex subunit 1-like isoform X2 [Gigantopelta aegis]
MPLPLQQGIFQPAVEPMQVDAAPEENDNVEEEQHYTVENPSVDLEQYSAQYTGLAKLNRLVFIAEHCPSLKIEALRMALTHAMTTYNTNFYQVVHKKLQEAVSMSSSLPDAVAGAVHNVPALDTQWIETTAKKAALKLEKLDTDLKNYKSNSIKESIRRGHDDLGDHYLDCGDLSNALKCYSRARDYCTNPKHVVNMCLNVIKVSVYLQNWSHVQSYVNKAEATPEAHEHVKDGGLSIQTKLRCAAGLADLATKKYKSAARYFLLASFDHCDFPELLSASNVATYGALCALASFDRTEIQKNVISSSSFKQFLELEPQLRDIINKFYESKYASCLKLLQEIKDNLLLDMYLAQHVSTLYTQIRNRALCQYFSPYLSADMRKMAQAFNTTVLALEDELMQLILDGQINARIDSHNKILYAKDIDQRSTTFEKAINMGKEYQRRTKALILRSAVLKNQIHVKSPPREGGTGGEMSIAPGNASSARN